MAQLNAKKRNALKPSQFALPGRRYPIHDKNHAAAALSMVAKHGSESEQKRVRAAVHRKFGKSTLRSSSK